MKNINIRNATRSDIHQLVYLRKQYLIEKYGVKEIENDNMLFFKSKDILMNMWIKILIL